MGFDSRVVAFSFVFPIGMILSLASLTGCQTSSSAMGEKMVAHVANIDFSGLTCDRPLPELNVRAALPHGWRSLSVDTCALYTHQQWRSPAHTTGVGVAYIHMPLPMSAKALVWLAKTQYSQKAAKDPKNHSGDAKLLDEWTDAIGREWFEGENTKYHIKGYVVTDGMSAWAVYSGYRLHNPPDAREINLAFRSMDSIVPLPLVQTELAQR